MLCKLFGQFLGRLSALAWSTALVSQAALAQTATAVEYYYAAWDYYFVTAFPDEIAVLDGGAFGGVWKRTGETFNVWTTTAPASSATCRFFSTSFAPKSSHFYTPFAAECDTVKASPDWQFESIAFYIQQAVADGTCPSGTIPLYRQYNNGMGGAPNHRYTTSLTVFNAMAAAGWVFEGNGNTKVFACVPPSSTGPATAEGYWRGVTSRGQNVRVVILDDGTYSIFYSDVGVSDDAGVVVGSGTSVDGAFTSVKGIDIPFSPKAAFLGGPASINGSYVSRNSLLLTYGTSTVSATYDPTYDVPATPNNVAGNYTGKSAHRFESGDLTAAADSQGNLDIQGTECAMKAVAAPRGSTNVFDLTLTTVRGPCLNGPGNTAQGILFYDDSVRKLYAVTQLFRNNLFGYSDLWFGAGTKR